MQLNSLLHDLDQIHDECKLKRALPMAIDFLQAHAAFSMPLQSATQLLVSMRGRKRAESLLHWLLEHRYIEVASVSPVQVEALLQKCDFEKDKGLAESVRERLKQYRRTGACTRPQSPLRPPPQRPSSPAERQPKKCVTPEPPWAAEGTGASLARPEFILIVPYETLRERIQQKLNLGELCVGSFETHLSTEDFGRVFGVPREEFDQLPRWKQIEMKRQRGLF